jgi:P pilus assembly chaperone PapD
MRILRVMSLAALALLAPVLVSGAQPNPTGSPRPLAGALPSGLAVLPIRLELSLNAPAGEITVFNYTADPVQFQVTGSAWDESINGTTELTVSNDFIAYPAIFSLSPGQKHVVRVGLQGNASSVERTFRITVAQLPSPQVKGQPPTGALGIQASFSIPVFLEPNNPTRQLELGQAAIHQQTLSFHVRNAGSAYDLVTGIVATGLDANGATVFTAKGAGYYVLAGHERIFTLGVPKGVCASVRSVKLAVVSDWSEANGVLPLSGSCQ